MGEEFARHGAPPARGGDPLIAALNVNRTDNSTLTHSDNYLNITSGSKGSRAATEKDYRSKRLNIPALSGPAWPAVDHARDAGRALGGYWWRKVERANLSTVTGGAHDDPDRY